jgi:iron(II)-dependent oxidoreductase
VRQTLRLAVLAAPFLLAFGLHAQHSTVIRMAGEQIDGRACSGLPQWFTHQPARRCTGAEIDEWLKDISHWRMEHRIRVGYDGAEYDRPELKWTQSSFIQPQMMIHDRYFYDPKIFKYTVSRYLDDTKRRYGGIDSVLVWPTYPNIGVDDRNQYDLFADMPGGIPGIRGFIEEFHKAGVKVLFPTMLWDQGTREQGIPDPEALVKELTDVGADGINGDTLQGVPRTFHSVGEALNHPLALEPELALGSDEMLKWNIMTWGYWKYDFVPTLSRYKWLEPRHMVNISNRWAHEHTDDLQFALFNGTGFESWENIWGIWNGITPRNGEALRRISAIERFGKDFLISADWEPHTPSTQQFGIYASKWPLKDETM